MSKKRVASTPSKGEPGALFSDILTLYRRTSPKLFLFLLVTIFLGWYTQNNFFDSKRLFKENYIGYASRVKDVKACDDARVFSEEKLTLYSDKMKYLRENCYPLKVMNEKRQASISFIEKFSGLAFLLVGIFLAYIASLGKKDSLVHDQIEGHSELLLISSILFYCQIPFFYQIYSILDNYGYTPASSLFGNIFGVFIIAHLFVFIVNILISVASLYGIICIISNKKS